MFGSQHESSGYEVIERALADLKSGWTDSIPSLNHLLDYKGFYITKDDVRGLRQWLKERKYKLIKTTDYQIVPRGKRK